MDTRTKTHQSLPWHAWVLGLVFLLFGLASGFDHVMSISQGESYYRASGMTEKQVIYFSSVPLWAVLAWTASVWGGLLGAGAILLHRRIALPLFAISVAGSLVYILYSFGLSAGQEAMGLLWPMPILVMVLTAGMIFYCGRLIKKDILV
jgi:hypothetical protein